MTAHYPGLAPIETYGGGGFSFAGMSHRGSILALPSGIYAWDPNPDFLTLADFERVLAEKDSFDHFIIGMGRDMSRPPRPVRDAFAAAGLMIDPMATGHAVSTYNLLLEERRRVAAALIVVDRPA